MVEMNTTWTDRFNVLNTRLLALTVRINEFEKPLGKAEEEAQMARWYAHQCYEHDGNVKQLK